MTQLPDTTTEAGQREASVMLARLMGWEVWDGVYTDGYYIVTVDGDTVYEEPNFYDPANMSLAWQVLNWLASLDTIHYTLRLMNIWAFEEWAKLPPAKAQRAWLDKILSLANEAGMLEVQP